MTDYPADMGRPQLGEKKRVSLMARVEPETLEKLDSYAVAKGISRGKAIDAAAQALTRKPKPRAR